MLSVSCFNLDQSKILPTGNGLNFHRKCWGFAITNLALCKKVLRFHHLSVITKMFTSNYGKQLATKMGPHFRKTENPKKN